MVRPVSRVGDFLWFCLRCDRGDLAIRHYPAQVGRQLAEVSLGGGALVVGGGAVGVVFLMSTLTGTEVGLEGHNGLDIIGLAPLVGFVSGYANTRELAPIIVALAFAARIRGGLARLGAMRISEEIDALEAMSIKPIPYLVSTRIVAAWIMVLPLFLLGLVGTYVTTDLVVTVFFDQFGQPLRALLHGLRVAQGRAAGRRQSRRADNDGDAGALLLRLLRQRRTRGRRTGNRPRHPIQHHRHHAARHRPDAHPLGRRPASDDLRIEDRAHSTAAHPRRNGRRGGVTRPRPVAVPVVLRGPDQRRQGVGRGRDHRRRHRSRCQGSLPRHHRRPGVATFRAR